MRSIPILTWSRLLDIDERTLKRITEMKRVLLVITTLCALLLLSCNEDYKLFPDKYNRILSLKNSGVRELRSGNTVKEYKDSILVLKGGGNPDNDAFARIEVMELGKACETFGYDGESIEIIASESYSIRGGDDIVLQGRTRSRYIPITFSPENIYNQALKAKGKTLVLPVVLRSETDTVNTSSSAILWKFDINGPKVVWPDRSDICEEISLREIDCDIEAKVEYSESNLSPFVGKIVKEGLETLVDEYNSKNSTSYKLLPESSWSFDGVDGINVEAKKEIVKGRLHLSREGLNSDETYLLPLKFPPPHSRSEFQRKSAIWLLPIRSMSTVQLTALNGNSSMSIHRNIGMGQRLICSGLPLMPLTEDRRPHGERNGTGTPPIRHGMTIFIPLAARTCT